LAQYGLRTVGGMDVALVRWPGESERRDDLRRAARPRLLLIERDGAPPDVEDCLEDWIRVPAIEADVAARFAALSFRAGAHVADVPALDRDGLLRFRAGWVSLPPVEARLTAVLVERFGAVVGRDAMARAGWPESAPGRNALDVHVLRLRRRLSSVGLSIKTVRSRGYLLEAMSDARQQGVGQA